MSILDDLNPVTAALAADADHYDRSGEFPATGIEAVHKAGLLTALGEGDPSVALVSAMTLLTHLRQAQRPHLPQELYQQVLKSSAERPTLLTAARGGLPATVARRTAEGWSVSGRERFVTGADGLSNYLVWAGTDEPAPRIATFAVPADRPASRSTTTGTSSACAPAAATT
ncbi:alkylation response protein AidB-like acyl-CoA dehydrogenase [Catenulispora sp. EB89]|uniref:hypothetical protein n=1 Tax=Catenulispora sp. EB89 TaxID=3156257 RepID=UPI003514F191